MLTLYEIKEKQKRNFLSNIPYWIEKKYITNVLSAILTDHNEECECYSSQILQVKFSKFSVQNI